MKKNQLIQCLALILIAGTARADDPEPRYQMPPIEVTATRAPREGFDLPLATAVIAEVGRARPGLSLAESLRPVPGLFIANRHNFSQGDRLSVRGLGCACGFWRPRGQGLARRHPPDYARRPEPAQQPSTWGQPAALRSCAAPALLCTAMRGAAYSRPIPKLRQRRLGAWSRA